MNFRDWLKKQIKTNGNPAEAGVFDTEGEFFMSGKESAFESALAQFDRRFAETDWDGARSGYLYWIEKEDFAS